MCFRAIGVDVRAEAASSHGQADMVVHTGGQVFVLEFKIAETDADVETKMEEAFTQMRDRGYANRYRDRQEPIHRIAVVCGREARNLLEVRAEPAVMT
ncbi:MAG: PD-(D/E)XK nuclease domain-containing protein [Rhodobacteraceae bacterium]|nr:PD-(D/E)XK nuclease domain-containing protein [Paracoccaceae bacterium]